jgi:hypothetical protein
VSKGADLSQQLLWAALSHGRFLPLTETDLGWIMTSFADLRQCQITHCDFRYSVQDSAQVSLSVHYAEPIQSRALGREDEIAWSTQWLGYEG